MKAGEGRPGGGRTSAGALALAALALAAAGCPGPGGSAPDRLAVAGLRAPLRIVRDVRGVPHVLAESEADAYFGLGFVHARDRLGQMLWLRRRARGRAAERLGAAELPGDRWARTLRFAELGARAAAGLEPATRRLLEAYAEGVNAALAAARAGRIPASPGVAGALADAEPWRPADTLAIARLRAFSMGETVAASAVLAELVRVLGGFGARPFFPQAVAGVEEEATARATVPVEPEAASRAGPDPAGLAALRRAFGLLGRGVGSSALLVGGDATRDGLPLLAADAHLEPTLPSPLHVAHLRGGGLDAAGAAVPGIPGFLAGINGHVAWAAVHTGAVVCDLYAERLRPGHPPRYHDGRRWRPARVREEEIPVRGREPERLVVVETRHGPLVDGLLGVPGEALALRWAGTAPGEGVSSLLRAARARSAAAFRAALRTHHEPVLAFLFADSRGAGGLQVAGSIPRRNRLAGLLPSPGASRGYEWGEPLSFDALPARTLGSGASVLIAADASLFRRTDPVRVDTLGRTGERARRIEALLEQRLRRGPVELEDLVEVLEDVASPGATELVQLAADLAGDPAALGRRGREVLGLLKSWDGLAAADRVGASVWHVFVERLLRRLYRDRIPPGLLERYLELPQSRPRQVVLAVLRAARAGGTSSPIYANASEVADAVRDSLRDTWRWLSAERGVSRARWSWGALHELAFEPIPPARAAGVRALGPWPHPGDGLTVAHAEPDPLHPFRVRSASTFRLLADLAEARSALVALAPGQSEDPRSPHHRDGVARLRGGRPAGLSTSPIWMAEGAASELRLEPAP